MIFYRLAVSSYHLLINLVALFSPKAKLWVEGRKDWAKKLQQWRASLPATQKVIWMHCSSLGEFEQGRPVLEAIRKQHPAYQLVLSFYSPSGFEQKKDDPIANYICYLPADSPSNAQKWLSIMQPELAIFVKYEFWLYHLNALAKRQIPAALIAANFRPEQSFFKWYGGIFRKALSQFQFIFTQKEQDIALLKSINIQHAHVAGDPRLDRVISIAKSDYTFPLIEKFAQTGRLFIAGSTWPPDEALLLHQDMVWPPNWKLLIAPHEIGAAHIQQIETKLKAKKYSFLRFTQMDQTTDLSNMQVVILDTIGMLSRIYRYGDLAYIGGGFGAGIHNTLEPVAHGLPVIFGPRYQKFPEANQLIAMEAGFSVENQENFLSIANKLLEDVVLETTSKKIHSFIEKNEGATIQIMKVLGLPNGSDRN